MESPPKYNKLLQLWPNTLEEVRKDVDLDKPGRLKEAIEIVEAWVQKQDHFMKKDFSKQYIEGTIVCCKGSIERSKRMLDRMCTLRTLLPHYFGDFNCRKDFDNIFDIVKPAILPKLTPEHYRTYWIKIYNKEHSPSQHILLYRFNLIVADYIKANDYIAGLRIVTDFSESNVMDFLNTSSLVELRQILTILMEGYGARVKGVHIITPSKLVDTLVKMLKQILSAKIAERLFIHKTAEEIFKYIPQELLPAEYGGKERPIQVILDDWLDVLSSEEHMNYIREMNKAVTDESRRQSDRFNEEYAGMPGTFRALSVD